MRTDLQKTAGLWRTGEASPLGIFAETGEIVAGIDREIQESLALVERGGLRFADYDPVEEHENLRSLAEHIQRERTIAQAGQRGRDHSEAGAGEWQRRMMERAGTGDVSASVTRFMRAVEDGDPVVLQALPTPAPDFTAATLMPLCGWPEPEVEDRRAHEQWAGAWTDVWNAYELAFYDAVQLSTSEWTRRTLGSLDQQEPAVIGPYLRPVSQQATVPPEWFVEPIGQWNGEEHEVVYDPRRFDVLVPRSRYETVASAFEVGGWELLSTDGHRGFLIRDRVGAARAALGQSEPSAEPIAPVEALRQIAAVRLHLRVPEGPAELDPEVAHRAALLRHEGGVASNVANALDGTTAWYEVVAAYSPSWRWQEFGEHDPTWQEPWRDGVPPDAPTLGPVATLELLAHARSENADALGQLAATSSDRAPEFHRDQQLILREAATMRVIADALAGRTAWDSVLDTYGHAPDWPEIRGPHEHESDSNPILENHAPAAGPRPHTLHVEIDDTEALRSLTPAGIRSYLADRGWREIPPEGRSRGIWELSSPGGPYEVLAPWNPSARDYHQVSQMLLQTLAQVENRSQLEIFRDLNPDGYSEWVPGVTETTAPESKTITENRPFLQRAGAGRSVPEGWVSEKVVRTQYVESEIVYDPRRYEVHLTNPTTGGRPDYVGWLESSGWRREQNDGSITLWVKDRVTAARDSLAQFDAQAHAQQGATVETPPPVVEK